VYSPRRAIGERLSRRLTTAAFTLQVASCGQPALPSSPPFPVAVTVEAGTVSPRPVTMTSDAGMTSSRPVARRVPFVFRTAWPLRQVTVRPSPTSVAVGEGWGCARFLVDTAAIVWQCWTKPGAAANGAAPEAWSVPWLSVASLGLNPEGGVVARSDRLCLVDPGTHDMHCFRPPARGDREGHIVGPDTKSRVPGNPSQWRNALGGLADVHNVAEGPRGLCYVAYGSGGGDSATLRCVGDIATPSMNLAMVSVSPGHDAAACGLAGESVWCWGEGYSPLANPGQPVAVAIEPPRSVPEVAAVQAPALGRLPWAPECLVQRGCARIPMAMTPCPAGAAAVSWPEVLSAAASLTGRIVHVEGPLGVGPEDGLRNDCLEAGFTACCGRLGAPVVLGGADETLQLGELGCYGDESELCCDAPAYGDTVIATGRLSSGPAAKSKLSPPYPQWSLDEVTLCSVSAGNGP
jgi:hypothetical protein